MSSLDFVTLDYCHDLSVQTIHITYLLTYSMVQSPSWEANWFAASQEIPRILWNPKVHYRTHKRRPPVPILGPCVFCAMLPLETLPPEIPSTIQHHIFVCASTSLSKSYSWAKLVFLDSRVSNVPTRWHVVPWTRHVYMTSRTFVSYSSIGKVFVSDEPIDVHAQMLLQDLTLTKNNGSSNKSSKSWEGTRNGASTTL